MSDLFGCDDTIELRERPVLLRMERFWLVISSPAGVPIREQGEPSV